VGVRWSAGAALAGVVRRKARFLVIGSHPVMTTMTDDDAPGVYVVIAFRYCGTRACVE
jgi:hypothetical protein